MVAQTSDDIARLNGRSLLLVDIESGAALAGVLVCVIGDTSTIVRLTLIVFVPDGRY